jgi:hypothetical protein
MTKKSQHHDVSTYRIGEDGSVRIVKFEAEQEEIEARADDEYIAMDIFVNPMLLREHFQYSSLRHKKSGIQNASA